MKFSLDLSGRLTVEIPDEKARELLDGRRARETELLDLLLLSADARLLDIEDWSTVCRRCGCTEDHACAGGCTWVEPDLCSRCATIISIAQDPTATMREEKA